MLVDGFSSFRNCGVEFDAAAAAKRPSLYNYRMPLQGIMSVFKKYAYGALAPFALGSALILNRRLSLRAKAAGICLIAYGTVNAYLTYMMFKPVNDCYCKNVLKCQPIEGIRMGPHPGIDHDLVGDFWICEPNTTADIRFAEGIRQRSMDSCFQRYWD
jgi:hypothetical protein